MDNTIKEVGEENVIKLSHMM